jgi:hypothetical protein
LTYELGLDTSNYVQFGQWNSLQKGLLSGERLQHDLQRLDTAYTEKHRLAYELTKHLSIAQLKPKQLLSLREE